MKKALISLLLALVTSLSFSQGVAVTPLATKTGISGVVLTPEGNPVENATVSIVGTNNMSTTDVDGRFVLENLSAGTYNIGVFANGFANYFAPDVKVVEGQVTELEISLTAIGSSDNNDGVVLVNADDLNNELGSENVSSILHGSRDAFLDAAAYSLGSMRFRIRGYDNSLTEISINGMDMSNMEVGRTFWSNWGGLNNVTRYKTVSFGLDASNQTFGNIGGSTDIQMMPSIYRKGLKVTYSAANRSYRNRAMITYSTGLTPRNWAFAFSGSHRWANEGYAEGTFYDAWSYYLGLEKHFKNQKIVLNVFGSPNKRGKGGASTQEAYDLLNNNYYNPYWGYQNGQKRNSRIANSHQPVALITHFWDINSSTKLQTTVVARAGRNGSTALNWYSAADPRPDYYRFLPSYITDPVSAQMVADSFANPMYSQIDWTGMYFANNNSYDVVENANGIDGNTVTGKRAQYIIEERRYDQVYGAINSNLTKNISDAVELVGGLQYRYFIGKNFKVVNDLLGADYWLDIDKYAERDIVDPDSAQSDVNNPNRTVKEGDIFGYNYNSNIQIAKSWLQTTIDLKKFNFNFAGFVSYTTMWREGLMKNGKFPDNSFGNSDKLNFLDYGGKTSIIFKINGRNFIQASGAYLTKAPTFRNVYISPRTRDNTIDNPVSEKIMSADIGYTLKAPKLKISLRGYYTTFQDQAHSMSFYHDGYRNFVNYSMQGINKTHQGIEAAIDGNIIGGLSAYAVASLGYYRYTSRPTVTITVDNNAEILAQNKTVYIQGFLVDGTPQTAGSAGLKYRTGSYWFFGINANYVDDIFLSANPERRTEDAVLFIPENSAEWNAIVDQTKLPSGYTLDASIGKSFRFNHKYYLNLNLNLSNILNNQSIITGGYEQLRYDIEDGPDKFPPKLYYMYGRQFFLNVSFSF